MTLDGIGIHGTVMVYTFAAATFLSSLSAFLYFWRKDRLDFDEGPKWQMMQERSDDKRR